MSVSFEAIDYAIKQYEKHIDKIRTKYIIIIDFNLPSDKKRLAVYDIEKKEIILSTYVTHGSGSGGRYATTFSNISGSHKSSLGPMVTAETYIGKHGLSLKLDGLDKTLNGNVRKRYVVIHGATYIGGGKTGRSWGCPAVPQKESKDFINLVKNGSLLVAYHDNLLL